MKYSYIFLVVFCNKLLEYRLNLTITYVNILVHIFVYKKSRHKFLKCVFFKLGELRKCV